MPTKTCVEATSLRQARKLAQWATYFYKVPESNIYWAFSAKEEYEAWKKLAQERRKKDKATATA